MTSPDSSHSPNESQQVQGHRPPIARRNPCVYCPRSFKRAEHLQRHIRIHTKDKPYICHCGTAFARRDLLTRHERFSHEQNSPYHRVQTSDHQASKSDTVAQSHADAGNAVDVSISGWTASNSEKGSGSQWLHQDHSSEAICQNLSNDALGASSQARRPVHSACAETATDQQYGQPMPQNNEDTFLSPEATFNFFNDDGSHFQEFATFLDGIGLPAEWTPPDIRRELNTNEAEAEGHNKRVSNDTYSTNDESCPGFPFGSWPPSVPQGDQPLSSVSGKG